MNSSMINAMVSMNALQQKLDVMANNIANINTVGYKKREASFQDLLYTQKNQPDTFNQPGRLSPLDFNQGWGSRLSVIQPNLTQGPLQATENPNDIAIEGNGLFEVTVNGDTPAYTRSGAFQLTLTANGDTILATENGYPVVAIVPDADGNPVEGNIIVPEGYGMHVNADGTVLGVSANETIELGRIKILQVSRPAALTAVSDNLFMVADGLNRDDIVQEITPDPDNGIALRQGFLEQSNVQMAEEMTELINVQRAYQLAARALSSSDTMMGLANTMRA